MQSNRFVVGTLIFALLLPASALAWDATGHELVAAIAWDNLTPAVREKAVKLLQSAPADACLLYLFPTDSRPLAVRQREFFIRAATWPDIVRAGTCRQFSHPDWHFIDHFWAGVSGARGSDAPKDLTNINTSAQNAVERLKIFRTSVVCDPESNIACASAADRATQLAWILHLVGDIHQPLHTASRVTVAQPTGDHGGSLFLLVKESDLYSLHSLWDRIIDDTVARRQGEKRPPRYRRWVTLSSSLPAMR